MIVRCAKFNTCRSYDTLHYYCRYYYSNCLPKVSVYTAWLTTTNVEHNNHHNK